MLKVQIWKSISLSLFLANLLLCQGLAFFCPSGSTSDRWVGVSFLQSTKTTRILFSSSDIVMSSNDEWLSQISYRSPSIATTTTTDPEDEIQECYAIETASYPSDEAATLDRLKYRQYHANDYFQCAYVDGGKEMIGFICSTRCNEFKEESMATHVPNGPILAIHSVVIKEEYRRKGIATAMLKRYLQHIREEGNVDGSIQSIVLLSKGHLLGFYVHCGFRVNRVSPIVHGQERWYELELPLIRSLPEEEESWFCKTERFKRPFHEVKPYLQEHKEWVISLRHSGICITSGYRVDNEGRPGGGGLMFLAAKSYDDALTLVQQDPLVANDCVEWELNGWIGQIGDIQMR